MVSIPRLLDILFPPRASMLRVRALSLEELRGLVSPIPIPYGTALLPYREPRVRTCITEAKFRGDTRAFQLLAGIVRAYCEDLDTRGRAVMFIPIPLSGNRMRERGYNQVLEVLKRADVPYVQLLKRIRDTEPQTSLGKQERLRNMAGAFEAADLDPAYLYIVVDDVATTGATLADAVRALRTAGALHVQTLSFSA